MNRNQRQKSETKASPPAAAKVSPAAAKVSSTAVKVPPAVANLSPPALPVALPLVQQMFVEAVNRHQVSQFAEAEALYRAIIALAPTHAESSYNLGLICHTQGRTQDAMICYRNAITVRPDYADAYSNLGTILQDLQRMEEAVEVYKQAIAIRPDYPMAYCNLGVALKEMGRHEESCAAYQKAIALKPDYDWAYANYSAVLLEMGRGEDSIAASKQAVAIKPDMLMAHFNLATGYKSECRTEEAIASFRQIIALQPSFVEAHFSLAQVLLMRGELEAGWREYEWRWKLKDYGWLKNIHGEFLQPMWTGEDLTNKTILIYAEQGLGDAIQFVRYIPDVVARAGKVILAVHPPLKKLFKTIEGVTLVTLDQAPFPPFDVHCPLLSLPRLFNTRLDTIPAPVPYLQAEPDLSAQWRARMPGSGLRVGIVWAGNPTQRGDRFRSPRLAAVQPLFYIPGVDFVTLQVGPGRQDIEKYPLPASVLDFGAEIKDFADTAAIMAGLDLVITSCTAPLHLAGALGVPVWGMIPFSPHFPWLLGREDNPWYPTLKLYRQDRPGHDWSGVVGRIAADLAKRVAAKP